ncbi:2694_t:CDS:2, partial [Entrophospora sp. SA101]
MSTKRRTTLTALQKKELCLLKQRDLNISNIELADIYNQLTKSEKSLLERFKSVVDKHKNIVATSQKQIANEICLNYGIDIGFNQSIVSK